jgi:cobalt/nickel transport system permease protein
MHITEGIITGVPAILTAGVAAGLVGVGARQMTRFAGEHPQKKPLLGMAGAFIFFISLIPIPAFTGTCSHPCGSPLAGILLGPWIGTALTSLSLLLQAAFFAHGGFSTWGVNTIALGVGGAICGWLTFRLARQAGLPIWAAGGLGGLIGDLMTYVLSGAMLAATLVHGPTPQFAFEGYLLAILTAYLPTQAPIALGEMVITGLALHYIYQQRPEILAAMKVISPRALARVTSLLGLGLVLALCLPAHLQAAPSLPNPRCLAGAQSFTGMDEAVNEQMAERAGRPARDPFINTEAMGDLWNCLLLLGGGTAGFVLGRSWHLLFGEKSARALAAPEAPENR